MVVDDDPIFRLLVGRAAEQMGHQDHLLFSGCLAEAGQVKARASFWVVDVNLPDGHGPEWVEQQRDLGFRQPVLLLSHTDCQADLVALQPCEFSCKPTTLAGLRQLMQGWWT